MAIANGTCVSFCNQPIRHILASLGTLLETIAVNLHGWKVDSMLVKRMQHMPIYLQPFTSYSEILVGNCNFFLLLACI